MAMNWPKTKRGHERLWYLTTALIVFFFLLMLPTNITTSVFEVAGIFCFTHFVFPWWAKKLTERSYVTHEAEGETASDTAGEDDRKLRGDNSSP